MSDSNFNGQPSDDLAERLREIRGHLKDLYLSPNKMAWVVGYSGGKDSTMLLQLVFEVIQSLPPKKRARPVYLICSDTRVEIPTMVSHVKAQLKQIATGAFALGVPLSAQMIEPIVTESFWTCLLGKGYVAPHKFGRWCTDRLKIRSANRFISGIVAKHKGCVLLLGSRSDESAMRARSIEAHAVIGAMLSPHAVAGAFTCKPISALTTGDVWHYLLQSPPPWGGNHRSLIAMYKGAGSECPLVIDKDTPSCGSSRTGCWTCTVVKTDHALEQLDDDDVEWAADLLEYRALMIETRESAAARQRRRRTGQFKAGPYHIGTRRRLLETLLLVQEKTGLGLISDEEIEIITAQWRADAWSVDLRVIHEQQARHDSAWDDDDGGE